MTILLIGGVAGTLCYILLLVYYFKYWKPMPSDSAGEAPFISVVIAARNEARHIAECLGAVFSQSYPQEKYEVIVIDDQSEDDTKGIVQGFPDVSLLRTTPDDPGKKQALQLGIAAARGEIIAMTDADCIVSGEWLETIAKHMDEHTQLVTGPVLYNDDSTAFARFQGLDLVSLSMITASGIKSRMHHMGNGANMAFRKDIFYQAGGFLQEASMASGDDLFLIQRIVRQFPKSMKYLWGLQSVVVTFPCDTVREFLAQRVRWATKNAFLPEKSIYRIWIGIWLVFLVNLISLILSLVQFSALVLIPGICILLIFCTDYLVLRRVANYYALSNLLRVFAVSAVLHYIYVLVMGFIVPFRKEYRWKGRVVG